MLTDRECAIAMFTAITGLAERLIGERMVVRVETETGQVTILGSSVQWEPSAGPAAAFPVEAASRPSAQA